MTDQAELVHSAISRALVAESELLTQRPRTENAEKEMLKAQAELRDAKATHAAECARLESLIAKGREDAATERAEKASLDASLSSLESRLLAAINVETPELPEVPSVDLSPMNAKIDALAQTVTAALATALAAKNAVVPRREIEKIVPIRGGPDNLIREAQIVYKAVH